MYVGLSASAPSTSSDPDRGLGRVRLTRRLLSFLSPDLTLTPPLQAYRIGHARQHFVCRPAEDESVCLTKVLFHLYIQFHALATGGRSRVRVDEHCPRQMFKKKDLRCQLPTLQMSRRTPDPDPNPNPNQMCRASWPSTAQQNTPGPGPTMLWCRVWQRMSYWQAGRHRGRRVPSTN